MRCRVLQPREVKGNLFAKVRLDGVQWLIHTSDEESCHDVWYFSIRWTIIIVILIDWMMHDSIRLTVNRDRIRMGEATPTASVTPIFYLPKV